MNHVMINSQSLLILAYAIRNFEIPIAELFWGEDDDSIQHPAKSIAKSTASMGRELQKKKKRSSIPKIKMKPKSKRVNPLGNAIIAANW